jgi:hypothetical protein
VSLLAGFGLIVNFGTVEVHSLVALQASCIALHDVSSLPDHYYLGQKFTAASAYHL